MPHAQAVDFDDSDWQRLAPADTMRRLSSGRVCFNWYRIDVTIPERVGTFDPTGATVVFEVAVDDYAEVWVNGEMPLALGHTGGQVVAGFNAPNRVVLTRDARPGDRFRHRRVRHQRPDLGLAGELHLDAHRHARLLRTGARTPGRPDQRRRSNGSPEASSSPKVPCGRPTDALLFSSPNTNTIYRLDPEDGRVTVFRSKSGYTGIDIGRYVPARIQRPRVLARRPADDLPARQPPGHPGQPAR